MNLSGKKKNIFVIPSWFPSELNPLDGTFTKEQVEALAAYSGDRYRYIVSDWGFSDTNVSFRLLNDAIKKVIYFLKRKRGHYYKVNDVHYIENPYLKISPKIPYLGSFDRLVDVHIKSIRKSEELFGKIDLIHAHVSYPAGFLSHKLSSILKIPYIITEHMSPFPFNRYRNGKHTNKEIDDAIMNANAVIAVSESHAAQIESYGFPKPRVIPNLVDETLFQPLPEPISLEPFTFFSLGFLEKRKGVHDLIKAISIWNPSAGKVRFGIGGDGEELLTLQALANQLDVNHLITWYGNITRDQAATFMKQCHAFVLPSYAESFGLVYAEAIACGKPVIATKCGGPESIVNATNGLLVPVADPEKLSEALQSIFANYTMYDPQKIRLDFEQRFSRKAVVEKISSLYDEVLN